MNKAVFLDRDGVINRKAPEGKYITQWNDFEFLPGAADAIKALNQAGFLVIVVTNQRCVAKGLLTESKLRLIHERMIRELKKQGAVIDAVYYCPHEVEARCLCRKPEPGMILQAAKDHDINLAISWMVGDCLKDVEAGKAAGCKTVWITESILVNSQAPGPDLTVHSLDEVALHLLNGSSTVQDR